MDSSQFERLKSRTLGRDIVYLGNSSGSIVREYPNKVKQLQAKGIGNNLLTVCEAVETIRHRVKPFHSKAELETFLDSYGDMENGQRVEHECLEFKCPEEGRDGILRSGLLNGITEAVCGMLNKDGGWVFAGITKDGEITGFRPCYKPLNSKANYQGRDGIQQVIWREIKRIQPCPSKLVSVFTLDIGDGRIVVSISVLRGRRAFRYKGTRFVRVGTVTDRSSV